jgi:hypothetical protein
VNNGRAFESVGGYSGAPVQWPLTGQGQPLQLDVGVMTSGAYALLGTQPILGRLPAPDEDIPDAPQVVVLGHGLWTSVFGADPSVHGRSIERNGSQWDVIGVMPAGYDFPTPETDVWVAYRLDPASENFGGHHIGAIARLAPGATIASAVSDAEGLIARFSEVGYGPTWFTGVFNGDAVVRTLKEEIVGEARQPIHILFGTVGFVLLIA